MLHTLLEYVWILYYNIFNKEDQMFLTPTIDVGHQNILIEYFGYYTRIFSIFNMDDRMSLALAVCVGNQNILVEYFAHSFYFQQGWLEISSSNCQCRLPEYSSRIFWIFY